MKRLVICIFLAAALLAATASCRLSRPMPETRETRGLLAVTTIYPLFEFTRQVGGDLVRAVNLLPPGVEPHDWEPSTGDVSLLQGARVFIYNGAGLEPWIERLGRVIPSDALVVEATRGIPLLKTRDSAPDPHVWLDPVYAGHQVELIRDALSMADPDNRGRYHANARAYLDQLEALNRKFERGLAGYRGSTIVVSHNAFSYLAGRYGLKVRAMSGPFPELEPTPRQVAELVSFIRDNGLKYVFVDRLAYPELAEIVAYETGARVLVLDPLERLTPGDVLRGEDYISVMERNLEVLEMALGRGYKR